MNKTQALTQLKKLGSEAALKTYARHGVTGAAFGVRYADMYKLAKQIGTDQKLAEQLWTTNNHDARILATMIADPTQIKATTLDAWAKTVNNELMLHAIAGLAASASSPVTRLKKWIAAKQEWTAATGWHLVASLSGGARAAKAARDEGDDAGVDDAWFASQLKHIEKTIHKSPNRVRHSMNTALIAIGSRGGALADQALAAAKRIGVVEVDHGETSCKTPDAAAYIRKVLTYRSGKKKKTTASAKNKVTGKKKITKKKKRTTRVA